MLRAIGLRILLILFVVIVGCDFIENGNDVGPDGEVVDDTGSADDFVGVVTDVASVKRVGVGAKIDDVAGAEADMVSAKRRRVGAKTVVAPETVDVETEMVDDTASVDETVEDTESCVIVPPPVEIPTDADWELIATLERNPLRPTQFYIFPEQAEAIITAYVAGKHFIFEIGKDPIETNNNRIRHYIIQPEPPFQDKHKADWQIAGEDDSGVKFHNHYYAFLSEGWYTHDSDYGAVGLGVEFSEMHTEPRGEFKDKGTLQGVKIGLIDQFYTPIVGLGGRSFIKDWVRLRIYVSK